MRGAPACPCKTPSRAHWRSLLPAPRVQAPNPAPGAYDRDTSGRWECNLANRTGGLWYSTLKEGEGKDWRLLATPKRVNATCMSRRWSNTIESKLAPACFQACPQPHNTSSTCYIECASPAARVSPISAR